MTGQIRAGNRYGIYMTLSVCRSVRALSINKDEKKEGFSSGLVQCKTPFYKKNRTGSAFLKSENYTENGDQNRISELVLGQRIYSYMCIVYIWKKTICTYVPTLTRGASIHKKKSTHVLIHSLK